MFQPEIVDENVNKSNAKLVKASEFVLCMHIFNILILFKKKKLFMHQL